MHFAVVEFLWAVDVIRLIQDLDLKYSFDHDVFLLVVCVFAVVAGVAGVADVLAFVKLA